MRVCVSKLGLRPMAFIRYFVNLSFHLDHENDISALMHCEILDALVIDESLNGQNSSSAFGLRLALDALAFT